MRRDLRAGQGARSIARCGAARSSLDQWFADLLVLPELRIEPVSAEVAQVAGQLADPLSSDPADRLIAATALLLKARLIRADERLRKSPHVAAVW